MVKVFYGKDPGYNTHTLYRELKKKLNSIELQSVEKYDGYKDPVSLIVEACQSISLFDERKTIVVSNAYFFLDAKSRKGSIRESEQDYKALEEYLMDPSPDTDLYISVPGEVVKSGTPNKALSSPAITLISCDIPSDDDYIMLAYRRAKEENKDIDREAAALLLERTKGDYLSFMNNLDKLFTYTKMVRRIDVEELVYRPLEEKVFSIVSHLVKGNIKEALHVYEDLRKGGNEPLGLLPIFATQFNNMALLKNLHQKGFSKDEIAKELGMKPGVVYYNLRDVKALTFYTLVRIMNDLSLIEKDIKINQDDGDVRLMLFITLFSKNYLRFSKR